MLKQLRTAGSLTSRIGALPLHSLLLAIAFVLNAGFANQVPLPALARPLPLALTATLALTLAFRAMTSSLREASIWTSALLVALISLQMIRSSAAFLAPYVGQGAAIVVTGIGAYIVAAGLAIAVLRSHRAAVTAERFNRLANRGSGVLLAVVLATGAIGALPSLAGSGGPGATSVVCGPAASGEPLPDIYHILLDGYPGAAVLEERFGFDNGPFLAALTERGFDVARDSHSNYPFTGLTLASMFNMRYLDQIPEVASVVGQPIRGVRELRESIDHASVFSHLRTEGYRIITTFPGWEHAGTRGAADEFLDHGEITDFERSLIDRTWIPELVSWFAGDWYADQQRSRALHAFQDIASVAQRPDAAPIFLYAHIPLPHLPIIFDESGAAPSELSMRNYADGGVMSIRSDAQYGPAYSSQLEYLNRLILDAVDAISVSPRERPAIVIVMSDHGYTHDLRRVDPHDRLRNLLAARTPGRPQLIVPPPTPVNLYRRLSASYLGGCGPELPDRYFISPDADRQVMTIPVADPDSHDAPEF